MTAKSGDHCRVKTSRIELTESSRSPVPLDEQARAALLHIHWVIEERSEFTMNVTAIVCFPVEQRYRSLKEFTGFFRAVADAGHSHFTELR